MAFPIAAALLGVGTAFNIFTSIKKGKDQARAAEASAGAKREQAFEILSRADTNIARLKEEAEVFRARQTAAFAASGVDVGSGASLLQSEQLSANLLDAVADQQREANFKAEQLQQGAAIDVSLAGDIKRSSVLTAIGAGLGGAGRATAAFKD